jgi:hypothetical protein
VPQDSCGPQVTNLKMSQRFYCSHASCCVSTVISNCTLLHCTIVPSQNTPFSIPSRDRNRPVTKAREGDGSSEETRECNVHPFPCRASFRHRISALHITRKDHVSSSRRVLLKPSPTCKFVRKVSDCLSELVTDVEIAEFASTGHPAASNG